MSGVAQPPGVRGGVRGSTRGRVTSLLSLHTCAERPGHVAVPPGPPGSGRQRPGCSRAGSCALPRPGFSCPGRPGLQEGHAFNCMFCPIQHAPACPPLVPQPCEGRMGVPVGKGSLAPPPPPFPGWVPARGHYSGDVPVVPPPCPTSRVVVGVVAHVCGARSRVISTWWWAGGPCPGYTDSCFSSWGLSCSWL